MQLNDGKNQFYLDLSFTLQKNFCVRVNIELTKEITLEGGYGGDPELEYRGSYNLHFGAIVEFLTLILKSMPLEFYDYLKSDSYTSETLTNTFEKVTKFLK